MTHLLTPAEAEILREIKCRLEGGRSPSIRELQTARGYASSYSVVRILASLERKARIQRGKGARAIRLCESATAQSLDSDPAQGLPILGVRRSNLAQTARVPATYPIRGESFVPAAHFLVEAAGRCAFPERGVFDGDLIAVRASNPLKRQRLVLLQVGGEFLLGVAQQLTKGWRVVGGDDQHGRPLWVREVVDGHPEIRGAFVGLIRPKVTSRQRS